MAFGQGMSCPPSLDELLRYDAAIDAQLLPGSSEPTQESALAAEWAGAQPLSAIPLLSSNPSATAQLYLDFDGDQPCTWGGFRVPAITAFDRDGDPATFTAAELSAIEEIWARVAEKYSPFNINVTTACPAALADGLAMRVLIGGDGAWTGLLCGGLAYLGAFYNAAPNTVYVFPENLGRGAPRYVAEAAAHEAGHGFGLEHQRRFSRDGKLLEEYHSGTGSVAPVMGNSYDSRGLWWYGTSSSPSTYQDDLAILGGTANGFGFRTDDHSDSPASATWLLPHHGQIAVSGVITRHTDKDCFRFCTSGGSVDFNASVAPWGPTLDLKLELREAAGQLLAVVDTLSLGESLHINLSAGIYYLSVCSAGRYGDVGQYFLTGAFAPAVRPAAPSGLSATMDRNVLTLRWTDNSDNETGFLVQRSSDGGMTWMDLCIVAPDVTQVTWPDPGAGWVYRVLAMGETQHSEPSQPASTGHCPDAPAGLSARSLTYGRIRLTWEAAAHATSYLVERSLDGLHWASIAPDSWNRTRYLDKGLDAGTTYYYRVSAVNSAGRSSPCAPVSKTTLPPALPAAPAGLHVQMLSQHRARLTWSDQADNERGFRIQWSADGNHWLTLASVGANRTTLDVLILRAGTSYFRVLAINEFGQSPPSQPVSVTVELPALRSRARDTQVTASARSSIAAPGLIVLHTGSAPLDPEAGPT